MRRSKAAVRSAVDFKMGRATSSALVSPVVGISCHWDQTAIHLDSGKSTKICNESSTETNDVISTIRFYLRVTTQRYANANEGGGGCYPPGPTKFVAFYGGHDLRSADFASTFRRFSHTSLGD